MKRFKSLSLSLLFLILLSAIFTGCGEGSNHNYSQPGGNNEEASQ